MWELTVAVILSTGDTLRAGPAHQTAVSALRTFALWLVVHIFHQCYNLYSVTEQDAIFCCLKVLLLNLLSFNRHLVELFEVCSKKM